MLRTKIEWADSTWSAVTGCRNDCPYCYARRTANRFKGCDASPNGTPHSDIVTLHERMPVTSKDGVTRNAAYPYGFTPTLHEYRLEDPKTKGFGETVFVCSMADLFGAWIPDEWIERVFDACKAAPGHRYLFLTKNPARYMQLAEKGLLPEGDMFWYGSTVTGPNVQAFYSAHHHTFVSIEPILEPFGDGGTGGIAEETEWAIIGAETGNRKDKVVPKRSWIEGVVEAFHANGKPVFMKDSLLEIWGSPLITEFPWQ